MRILPLSVFLMSFSLVHLYAQQEKIEVSFDKSVALIFTSNVKEKGWNCGAKELVGVAVKENKILLQAKEEYFDETNLIVECVDGRLYAFDLVYNNSPKSTVHLVGQSTAAYTPEIENKIISADIGHPEKVTEKKVVKEQNINVKETNKDSKAIQKDETTVGRTDEEICQNIRNTGDYLKRIGLISRKMFLYVGGIYAIGDKIYFKVNLKNVSSITYDISYSQFIVKNTRSGITKTVSAEVDRLKSIYVYQPSSSVGKDEVLTLVYVFTKFTIAENKKLFIEFMEKNGDRDLELPIKSIEILNAKNTLQQ